MTSKSMIQTFSYPLSKVEVIEEATKIAKADGVSFSTFIISLLEEQVRKKVKGSTNPLNLPNQEIDGYMSNTPKEKPSLSDLRQWMPQKQTIITLQRMNFPVSDALHLSQTFAIYANRKKGGYFK